MDLETRVTALAREYPEHDKRLVDAFNGYWGESTRAPLEAQVAFLRDRLLLTASALGELIALVAADFQVPRVRTREELVAEILIDRRVVACAPVVRDLKALEKD